MPSKPPGPEDLQSLLPVSRETEKKLKRYADLLVTWQSRINLVSPATLPAFWTRHIADSAQLLPLAPNALVWVDLGSGAGLPGLVIAVLLHDRPGACVHLIESNAKKAAFLRTAIRETGAPAVVHHDRIENVLPSLKGVDVLTARALASLDRLLAMVAPHLETGAIALFPKGQGVDEELTVARRSWTIDVDIVPSRTDPDARILIIRSARLKKDALHVRDA